MILSLKNTVKKYAQNFTDLPLVIISPSKSMLSVLISHGLVIDEQTRDNYVPALYMLISNNINLLCSKDHNNNEVICESTTTYLGYIIGKALLEKDSFTGSLIGSSLGSLIGNLIARLAVANMSSNNFTVGAIEGFVIGYSDGDFNMGALGMLTGICSYSLAESFKVENYVMIGSIIGSLYGQFEALGGAIIGGLIGSAANYFNIFESLEIIGNNNDITVSSSDYL